jgi:hypothetical protein
LLFFKFLFCKYQNIFTANIFKQNTLAVFPGHFSLRNTAAVFKHSCTAQSLKRGVLQICQYSAVFAPSKPEQAGKPAVTGRCLCKYRHFQFQDSRTFCRRPPDRCAEHRISGVFEGKSNLQMFFRASPPGHAEAPGGDADRTNRKSRTSAAFSVVSTFTGERLLRRIADFQRIVTGGVATHQNVDIGIGGAVSGTVFGRAGTVGFAIVSRGGWHRHLRTYNHITGTGGAGGQRATGFQLERAETLALAFGQATAEVFDFVTGYK